MLSGTIEMLGGTVGMLAPGWDSRDGLDCWDGEQDSWDALGTNVGMLSWIVEMLAGTVGMLSSTAGMLWVGKLGCWVGQLRCWVRWLECQGWAIRMLNLYIIQMNKCMAKYRMLYRINEKMHAHCIPTCIMGNREK